MKKTIKLVAVLAVLVALFIGGNYILKGINGINGIFTTYNISTQNCKIKGIKFFKTGHFHGYIEVNNETYKSNDETYAITSFDTDLIDSDIIELFVLEKPVPDNNGGLINPDFNIYVVINSDTKLTVTINNKGNTTSFEATY